MNLSLQSRLTIARAFALSSPQHRRTVQFARGRQVPVRPTRLAVQATMLAFTPLESGLAGLTLGLMTAAKLQLTGRVLGISGAVRGIVRGDAAAWRVAFLSGLVAGGLALKALLPSAFELLPAGYTLQRAAVAGLLVGLGTSRGSGCTSGHGICGNARLSLRSLVATVAFMATGAVAARLAETAALFSLPRGIAPLAAAGPWSPTAKFAVGLLAVAATTWLALARAAKGVAAPARAESAASIRTELRQAGALEKAQLNDEPPSAGPEAQQLASLATAADMFVGFLFALGLGASGMLQPSKVTGFLSVLAGTWDPSLAFVMGGALLVALPAFQLTLRRTRGPACASCYELPFKKSLDADLVLGSLTFGAGWGIGGLCPGPAIVALTTLQPAVFVFVVAMLMGMRLDQNLEVAQKGSLD
ncbi:hypothetical protein D9Q98_000410 [Chlorella vulgaris]|uniref:Sulphur transport domain-containing protein n=1 Tax=Chlorella vulgaris TaxID=3077 RepID=A0A9D4Z255_CHLVU|nr:hypothetical protein D9Q98_000410 [Chlorella vulgaris]